MCFCLCRLNQAVFLGRAKPWPNFPGIMQNCIGISMILFPGLQVARKYLEMGLFSPPRYSIFSGDHGLLVWIQFQYFVFDFHFVYFVKGKRFGKASSLFNFHFLYKLIKVTRPQGRWMRLTMIPLWASACVNRIYLSPKKKLQ